MADKPRVWDAFLTREFIYIPQADDNKYTRGVVGLVAGSKRFPGAAILAARASLATGVEYTWKLLEGGDPTRTLAELAMFTTSYLALAFISDPWGVSIELNQRRPR